MATTAAIDFTMVGENWGIDKTVGSRKDYGVNAAARLAEGDSIDPASCIATGVGVTVDGPAFLTNGTYVMAWVMGGDPEAGTDNYVDLQWSTVGGRIETQRLHFRIKP